MLLPLPMLLSPLLFLLFALPLLLASGLAQHRSVPIPLYMDRMLSAGREVYDKQSTPTQNAGVPTAVRLAMYIEGIGSFRTHTMDFQLDVYLQQFWKDPRLAHNESSRILIRDRAILDRIWHPDVYFANARIAQFHEVTQPNFLLWIEPDGSILYDTRVSMVVICAMNLKNFPLDSQWCHLRILSYAYDIHHLEIEWVEEEPITKNLNITMSDMDIVKLVPGTCNGNYSTGVWSCVTAEFFVSRELTHHILQTYVPTTLIVVISWFSFWLDVEAVPARVSLAITTLLTLSTQANSVKNSLPEVSYMKSLDLFLAVSVLFVFGVLIEFTIVNYTQRNATMAAAGLVTDKDERDSDEIHSQSVCRRIRLALRQLLGRQKGLKTIQPKSKLSPRPSEADITPSLKFSFLQRLSQRRSARRKGSVESCCCSIDIESGTMATMDANNNHFRKKQKFEPGKKVRAIERDNSQLQHINTTRRAENTLRPLRAPIIVCEDEDDEEVLLEQRDVERRNLVASAGVGQREAARLANWARTELSFEGLATKANGKQQNLSPPTERQPPLPDNVGTIAQREQGNNNKSGSQIPPLAKQEGSSSTSSSPLLTSTLHRKPSFRRATSFVTTGSREKTKETTEKLSVKADPIKRHIMLPRRASAMASLLDPINIGSGKYSQQNNVEEKGEGKAGGGGLAANIMSAQAKWRHAVRKLQMNKREAGRIQAKKIDAWSRWAFPLSYLSFHAAYWYYYLRVAA